MTLDEQYQKVIDDQRKHLMQLQDDFNELCNTSKKKAQEKLDAIPADDKTMREEILKEEKTTLAEALKKLKEAVDASTRDTMKKLEAIVREKEKMILDDLENQIAKL